MTTRIQRRPMSQIEQLRAHAYRVRPTVARRLAKAQDHLSEEIQKLLRDRYLSAYISSLVEFQANYDALVLLDWLLGEGINDQRYRAYFTEQEDLDLFLPIQVYQPDEVRSAVNKLDPLRRDERYDLYNLVARNYTEDVLDHLIRRYWQNLAGSEESGDDEMRAIYLDIKGAIEQLPASQQKVVRLVADGWTLKDVGTFHHVSKSVNTWRDAKKNLARILGDVKQEESDGEAGQAEG